MFQSEIFCSTFTTATETPLELYTTDGSEGAARGAGVGAGIFSLAEAYQGLHSDVTLEPDTAASAPTRDAYERWKQRVVKALTAGEQQT
jgi:xylulokinase